MNKSHVIKFFLNCINNFRWLVLGQFFVAIVWAIDLSLRPYLIKVMLDKIPSLVPHYAFDMLWQPATFYIFMSALSVFIFRFNEFIWLNLNSGLKKYIGLKLMDRMTLHSYCFYQDNFAGNLASKIKDVMSGIPDLSKSLIDKFFGHILALLIAIFTLWQASPRFAVGFAFWITIYLIGSFKLSFKARVLCKKAAEARSQAIGYLIDALSNVISIRLFNTNIWEKNKFTSILQKYVNGDRARDWFFIKLFSFQGFSFVIYQGVCLFWLTLGFKNQSISAGDFVLVLTLNISIVDCLWSLSKEITLVAEHVGNIAQALKVIYSPLKIEDKPAAKDLVVSKGEIIFNNVQFKYSGSKLLFKNKSVIIKSKQKVGLVGYSGSGKSTFINLILRFFDVTSGKILIDKQDIRNITQDSLRRAISLIPQDPLLFHRTLMENIRYGNTNASEEEVVNAAKLAHAHEFIVSLPNGYESLVGERGIKLSGGQRQRIAIARAILKNAPILLLDEATSHLDSVTENYIQESLLKIMRDKTTVVIAHRLSTLLYMDRILVFNDGKIVEDGNHKELLKNGGLYKTLWHAQVGGFLPSEPGIKTRYS